MLARLLPILLLVNDVHPRISYDKPILCLNEDLNSVVCSVIENFFGYGPLDEVVKFLANAFSGITSWLQLHEIILYITQSFGPNPLDTTNYETISKSFNFVIFYPNSRKAPRNISTTDVLHSCDALELDGGSTKLIWSGYGVNCYGRDPSKTIFDWTVNDMQQYAILSNSTIIVVEWGFNGLSCYGYVQITICLIDKIVDFIAALLTNCVKISSLEIIGHSFGAQLGGYLSQRIKSLSGIEVQRIIGLDPAGPMFGHGLRCQGIQKYNANYSLVFHSNPCEMGTCDLTFGDTNILVNPDRGYCQPNCACMSNPRCSHSYVVQVFLQLAHRRTLSTVYAPYYPVISCQPDTITIYGNLKPGYYILDTYDEN